MMSPLALQAKRVIESAWLHGTAYDLASQAAFALESTQMLQSPETVAELERLRERVAELEAERHVTNEALDDAVQALRARREDEPVEDPCRPCGCPKRFERHAWGCPALAAKAVEGEHYAAVHHAYRVPRDLPETGGAR